jgi:glycosyltransferase involved in cell wall biosynthesis
MIVKNESKVIRRMLESVAPFLDSYCICDTGSTDDTIDLIRQFFQERNIPGQIVQETFRDFGHNRTVAIQAAAQMPPETSEYVLLMDADMVLWHHPDLSVHDIKSRIARFRVFQLYQGTDTYYYKNVRIVKNRMNITYWGVTHEYVKIPDGETIPHGQFAHDELFIRDIGDGGCKSDKFARDIRLLTQGLVDLPNNDRYTFYLANSYRDHGDWELAVETYHKRIAIGGWVEELWQSYYSIAKCYMDASEKEEEEQKKKQYVAQAIFYWLEGFHVHPQRIENLYHIVQYYRKQGQNALAYQFYRIADQVRTAHPEHDFLFTHVDVYTYKLDYELSIIGYYCNPDQYDLARVSMNVLRQSILEESIYKNVLSNYKFYAISLSKYAFPMCTKNIEALAHIGRDVLGPHLGEYVSSTPSMCFDAKTGDLVVCVRYVNYRINAEGGYEGHTGTPSQSTIGTKNVIARFSGVYGDYDRAWRPMLSEHERHSNEYELICDPKYNDGRYCGLEDVRLFSYDKYQGFGDGAGRIIYNANRGLEGCSAALAKTLPAPHDKAVMTVEHGWIVPDYTTTTSNPTVKCTNSTLLVYEHANPHLEKNWALFGMNSTKSLERGDNRITLKCVYSWSPLVLGSICPMAGTFTETHRFPAKELPYFFKDVRCSTCGVNVGNEIWFIGHLVSYEDRRYYYHLMIVLDGTTLALKKYTRLWTFDQEKVEYTLGMVFFPEQQRFLIGYSVMDRETKYMMLSKHIFDDRMITNI